jgi:peroxisomal enoyl-CoA hydratase 2
VTPLSDGVAWNDPPADVEWSDWAPTQVVRIEHAPVALFARAVKDDNPVYASERAARDAGFENVPVPPTFSFAMTSSCAFADLQTDAARPLVVSPEMPARKGLFLHGEQHFTYHRQLCVGDVLHGRMRTSKPVAREARRGPMEVTWFQTRWSDPDGEPVVDEQIVSLFFPEG